jgi:predicted helicase
MHHFLTGDNIGLVSNKPAQGGSDYYSAIFVTKNITDQSIFSAMKNSPFICPLYMNTETTGRLNLEQSDGRTPNLNADIVKQIADNLGLTFTNEKETTKGTFAPIDILDYIYAILHSPTYREKYKEFLKIDFPRVPYPKDKDTFWKLVKLGGEIRQIHLLESDVVDKPISKYPHTGTNVVVKIKYENGNVYINETQCFEDVPEVAWNFYIGGYQPAQKWLKDRKDRELQIDDIRHYMKIIVALTETDRLMKEIDKIEIE